MIMQLSITETHAGSARLPFLNMRWGAIFASLAVGIAANIVLMLAGTAAGLSVFDVAQGSAGTNVSLLASLWNAISMIISALIGGYVAARASGLKRTSDGILHAVVAWGMTLLLSVFTASSVTGATVAAIFAGAQETTTAHVISNIDRGNRDAAAASLQRDLGLGSEQAYQLVDQALALSGRDAQAGAEGRAAAQHTVRTFAAISIWLTLSIILSLIAAVGGGVTGARASRRVLHQRNVVAAAF